jgi:hypothetical protein
LNNKAFSQSPQSHTEESAELETGLIVVGANSSRLGGGGGGERSTNDWDLEPLLKRPSKPNKNITVGSYLCSVFLYNVFGEWREAV